MITFPTAPERLDYTQESPWTDPEGGRWFWEDDLLRWRPFAGFGGSGGGATTFAALTDKASADLPTINTPLSNALGLLAPKASPTFTGTVTIPSGASISGYATTTAMTAAITAAIDGLLSGAPGALDTLNELAAALGDDANFATTVTNALASKVPTTRTVAGKELSGNITLESADISDRTSNGLTNPGKVLVADEDGSITLAQMQISGVAHSDTGIVSGTLELLYPTAAGTFQFAVSPNADGSLNPDDIGGITVNTESTTARTLAGADLNTKTRYTNASGCAITIPNGIGVAGKYIIGRRATGAGALSFSLGGSVTVNNSGIASITAGQEFALMAVGTNEYDFV